MRQWHTRRLGAACALLALAGQVATAKAAASDWTLDASGFGPLKIGMSFAQAQRVAGPALRPTAPSLLPGPSCDQLALPGHPGVALMFVDGVLHRVDVFQPGIRTTRGIAAGDPVEKVSQVHAGLTRTPNAYDEREAYLTLGPEHGRALRFETAKGRIATMYAGDWAQVQYMEGCL
jgi:hypothetical protein